MNCEEIFTTYFYCYDTFFEKEYKASELLNKKYHEIKNKMWESIKNVKKENFFHIFREVLDLDAQLQILVSLIESGLFTEEREQTILTLVESDYISYYKEAFNYTLNDPSPHTILHIFQ